MSSAIARARARRQPVASSARYQKLLDAGRLSFHYQPIVDLRSGTVLGIEALARLTDGDRLIFPIAFVGKLTPDALRNLFLTSITRGLAVLSACQRTNPDLGLPLNLPSSVLIQADFASALEEITSSSTVQSRRIMLEILEEGEFLNLRAARRQIRELRARMFSIALDDIGTAYSSLMRLKELPVDTIKLDQGFVRGLMHTPENLIFVSSMICLARNLHKQLVVEGVETLEILDALQVMGVEAAQGFGIAPPMSAETLIR